MADINERGGWSSFDQMELDAQKKATELLKKQIMAKRGITPEEPKKKKKKPLVNWVNPMTEMERELRLRFVELGKEVPKKDTSISTMHEFLRDTDPIVGASKNAAGGAFFTSKNKENAINKEKYGDVYTNARNIYLPISRIRDILNQPGAIDAQRLERIKYQLQDLCDVLEPSVEALLRDLGKDKSNFMTGKGGHYVGFMKVLNRLLTDAKKGVYENLIYRIQEAIDKGKDPMSYNTFIAESKKIKITEGALRSIIKESIIRALNEDTTDETLMDRWNNLVEALGAQEMCNALFKAMSHDQIEEMVEFLERNYEVGNTYDLNYDEEY